MKTRSPRLSVRAILLHENRLLLVNAYPGGVSDLWCAPGGGVEPGRSLPDNLRREVHEETGLTIEVGPLALVNEFHDPKSGFHQVDLFFRAAIAGGRIDPAWSDPAGIVTDRRFFARDDLALIRLKPDSLAAVAWRAGPGARYDPLEEIVP
jgi:ADP-ribose pyrophosphatase YjhB (NUDIX family)